MSERDAALAAAIGAPIVIVTHGPEPVSWFHGGQSGTIPVPPVPAIDTAGAGDAFHGALAVALTQHFPPDKPDKPDKSGLSGVATRLRPALEAAIRVAGVRVTHAGPRSWLAAL